MTDKYKFTQADVNAINNFLSLACYNGWEDDVKNIMRSLKQSYKLENELGSVQRPAWKKKCGKDKIEEFGGIFWSWLVLGYGEYGTSPRFGWIYRDNAQALYDIMDNLLRTDGEYRIGE